MPEKQKELSPELEQEVKEFYMRMLEESEYHNSNLEDMVERLQRDNDHLAELNYDNKCTVNSMSMEIERLNKILGKWGIAI